MNENLASLKAKRQPAGSWRSQWRSVHSPASSSTSTLSRSESGLPSLRNLECAPQGQLSSSKRSAGRPATQFASRSRPSVSSSNYTDSGSSAPRFSAEGWARLRSTCLRNHISDGRWLQWRSQVVAVRCCTSKSLGCKICVVYVGTALFCRAHVQYSSHAVLLGTVVLFY